MEELTGFRMNNSLTLSSLAKAYLNCIGGGSDEEIYTYNAEKMR